MLETLLRCTEIHDYLSLFPRKDWVSCIEATLRIGIRRVRKSSLPNVSLDTLQGALETETNTEAVATLKEKMTSLRKELEVMSKDLTGFESKPFSRTDSSEVRKLPRAKQQKPGSRKPLTAKAERSKASGRVRTEGSEDIRNNATYSSYQPSPPPLPYSPTTSQKPPLKRPSYDSIQPVKPVPSEAMRTLFSPHHVSGRKSLSIDLESNLKEPKTNKNMLTKLTSQRAHPAYDPLEDFTDLNESQLSETQGCSAVLAIADEFLANPIVTGLASFNER